MKLMLTVVEYVSFAILVMYRLSCILEHFITIQLYPTEDDNKKSCLRSPLRAIMKPALSIVNFTSWSLHVAHRGSLALTKYFGKPCFESEVLYHQVLVASPEGAPVDSETSEEQLETRTALFEGVVSPARLLDPVVDQHGAGLSVVEEHLDEEQAEKTTTTCSSDGLHVRQSRVPPGAMQQRMSRAKFAQDEEEE